MFRAANVSSKGGTCHKKPRDGVPLAAASKALHALDESKQLASFLDLSSAHNLLLSGNNFLKASASTVRDKHQQLRSLASDSFFSNHPDMEELVNKKFVEVDMLVRPELELMYKKVG